MRRPKTTEIKPRQGRLLKNSSAGSVSLEYIIVSCFALLISITAVTWLGKMVRERISSIAERLHLDVNGLDLDFETNFDIRE